jgi:hypothetical protein
VSLCTGCLNGGGQIKAAGGQGEVQAHLARLDAIHEPYVPRACPPDAADASAMDTAEAGEETGGPVLEWPEQDAEAHGLYRAAAAFEQLSAVQEDGKLNGSLAFTTKDLEASEVEQAGSASQLAKEDWFHTRYHKRERTVQTLIMDW